MRQNSQSIFSTIFLVLVVPVLCVGHHGSKCVTGFNKVKQEAIFVELTNETNYKKWLRPYVDTQVVVNTSIEIYSMASLNERESEFALNLLIDLIWNDDRLEHKNSTCEGLEDLSIEGSEWHFNRIWSPKLRVPNNKDPAALDRDSKIILLRVSTKGNVRVRKRLTLDLYCQMYFHYYPFDRQNCKIQFISSDLSLDHLLLNWTDPVEEDPLIWTDTYITGFDLGDLGKVIRRSGSIGSKSENFSYIEVVFNLKREWSHFLLDVYLPSFLVIIVSWISFWMDITATPARITLGVTTMLTFVTVAKDSREALPNFSYINALDIWFVVCTGFIFFSLIEFIIITYISRAEKRKIREMKTLRRNLSQSQLSLSSSETQTTITTNDGIFLCPPKSPNPSTRFPFEGFEIKVPKCTHPTERPTVLPFRSEDKKVILSISPPDSPNPDTDPKSPPPVPIDLKMTPVEIAEAIDRKCRYLFPLAFVAFNIIYWIIIITKQ